MIERIMGTIKILQANLNHSSGAQDLTLQFICEGGIDLGCFSEPWSVPRENTDWYCCGSGRAAIYCGSPAMRRNCRLLVALGGWVGVEVGDIRVVLIYLSPNEGLMRFCSALQELSDFVKVSPARY